MSLEMKYASHILGDFPIPQLLTQNHLISVH